MKKGSFSPMDSRMASTSSREADSPTTMRAGSPFVMDMRKKTISVTRSITGIRYRILFRMYFIIEVPPTVKESRKVRHGYIPHP